jgi:hypothetical protein
MNASEPREDAVAVLQKHHIAMRAGYCTKGSPLDTALTAAIAALAQQGAEPVAVVMRGLKRAHVCWIGDNEATAPDGAKLAYLPATRAPR